MKKVLLIAVAALALSSCSTISHTSYTGTVNTEMYNRTSADLEVSDKVVSTTYVCDDDHNRAGLKSCQAAAIQKALEENGGGDLIVNPQFEVKKTRGVFFTKIKYVKVTGHVARYKNFHPLKQAEADIIVTLKRKK